MNVSQDMTILAWATDRFMMAKATYFASSGAIAENETYYLDDAVVKFIKDNSKSTDFFTLNGNTIATDNGNVCILPEITNYPPIESMMTDEALSVSVPLAGQYSVDFAKLSRLSKLFRPCDALLAPAKRDNDWRVSSLGMSDNPSRPPKPLLWISGTGDYSGNRIEVLVQPKLIK
jgi:hypothetical protein